MDESLQEEKKVSNTRGRRSLDMISIKADPSSPRRKSFALISPLDVATRITQIDKPGEQRRSLSAAFTGTSRRGSRTGDRIGIELVNLSTPQSARKARRSSRSHSRSSDNMKDQLQAFTFQLQDMEMKSNDMSLRSTPETDKNKMKMYSASDSQSTSTWSQSYLRDIESQHESPEKFREGDQLFVSMGRDLPNRDVETPNSDSQQSSFRRNLGIIHEKHSRKPSESKFQKRKGGLTKMMQSWMNESQQSFEEYNSTIKRIPGMDSYSVSSKSSSENPGEMQSAIVMKAIEMFQKATTELSSSASDFLKNLTIALAFKMHLYLDASLGLAANSSIAQTVSIVCAQLFGLESSIIDSRDPKQLFKVEALRHPILILDHIESASSGDLCSVLEIMCRNEITIDGFRHDFSQRKFVIAIGHHVPGRNAPFPCDFMRNFLCHSQMKMSAMKSLELFIKEAEDEENAETSIFHQHLMNLLQAEISSGITMDQSIKQYIRDCIIFIRRHQAVSIGPCLKGTDAVYLVSRGHALFAFSQFTRPVDVDICFCDTVAHRLVLRSVGTQSKGQLLRAARKVASNAVIKMRPPK